MRVRTDNLLQNKAGEDGSAAGGGSLLTTSGGGGTSQVSKGDANTGDAASANQTTPGNNSASGATTGGANNDWKSALPKELQDDPSIKLFNDVSALAKSYIHAQKLVGADKIPVPSKHATDEDWKGVYKKLGLPEDVKEYALNFPESVSIDKDFVEAFKTTAHQAGILPKQAQALADWFSKTNADAESRMATEFKSQQAKNIEALKTEWGEAFQPKLNKAQQVLREAGSPELLKYLEDTGLGNDTNLIRLLAGIGDKFLREGGDINTGASSNAMTPKDAQKEYAKVMADMAHPYWVKEHPGHKAAIEEVATLFKMANPGSKTIDFQR